MRPWDWLLPGLGHLRHGFRREAVKYLLFMGLWGLMVVGLRDRVLDQFRPPMRAENWVAAAFLVLWPAAWIVAARRGLRRLLEPRRREAMSQWQIALQMLRRNPRAVWGMRLLGIFYMVAFLCPVLAPIDPEFQPKDTVGSRLLPPLTQVFVFGDAKRGEVTCRAFRAEEGQLILRRGDAEENRKLDSLGEPRLGWKSPPNRSLQAGGRSIPYRAQTHLLGTDYLGHDIFSGLIYGSRISLSIGFIAMLIAVAIGAFVGTTSGFFGGAVDFGTMRVVDVLMAFPRLLLLMLIYAAYASAKKEASIFVVVAILGATGWMGVSRLVRAEVLTLKERDFSLAARALGLSRRRIMFRHLLPNAMAPLIVDATLRVGDTILTEAALSFLGMGVQRPTPSWGNIVASGEDYLREAWWIATIPGLAIVLVVASFNLVGDALRDALDPRLRH